MHQLFRGLDAKPDDSYQQKNHGVEFARGVFPETLQSCLLDDFNLLVKELKSASFCSCGQPENSHTAGILPIGDEFRERIIFR